jgi:hypothetical protein
MLHRLGKRSVTCELMWKERLHREPWRQPKQTLGELMDIKWNFFFFCGALKQNPLL